MQNLKNVQFKAEPSCVVAAISGAPSSFILRQLDPLFARPAKIANYHLVLIAIMMTMTMMMMKHPIPDKLGMCRNGDVEVIPGINQR